MGTILRPIAASDQDFLWEMLYQAVYVPPGSPAPPREIIRQPELAHYVQDWPQPGDLGFIAAEATTGKPLGAAWLRLFSAESPGYGFVAEGIPELSVAVLPECRGQGVGTALLEGLLAAARGQYAAVSLSVSAGNPAAKLYRRLGFAVYEQTGDSLTMVLKLLDHESQC
ncbi:MAG: GNAT family N-acetyltransferase [Anaerolineaceae bacterium]|nr:GNAT family N-acetyltransferase [Anaerolineaceae bacterium]